MSMPVNLNVPVPAALPSQRSAVSRVPVHGGASRQTKDHCVDLDILSSFFLVYLAGIRNFEENWNSPASVGEFGGQQGSSEVRLKRCTCVSENRMKPQRIV